MAIICGGWMVFWSVRDLGEAERLSRLAIEANRGGVEIMSQTLNGNVMGALSALSLIDDDLRRDALSTAPPNGARILGRLESIGRSYHAEGVFVVGQNGVVASSWDSSGKPSTGLNVRFRPYFQIALQGSENVYAAVSLARGDRALYFTQPIFAHGTEGDSVGAVVARLGVARMDALLRNRADIALLLSPQGVVFAGNRTEWIGFLAGEATPERLKAIRDLKQFGAMFDNREPKILPFPVAGGVIDFDGRRHAVAVSNVQWNDPQGNWSLVLLEDLSQTVPMAGPAQAGLAATAVLLVIGVLILNLLTGYHARVLAMNRVEDYARAQEASVARKSRLAEAALRFQRAKTPNDLSRQFLSEAHDMLSALQGVIYARGAEDDSELRLAATFACTDQHAPVLSLGEGLLGQCALDRQTRVLEVTDDGAWTIRSGLGNALPSAVMMAPLVLDERLLGVVEIAVFNKPDQSARDQFAEMTALLALNLEILRRHSPANVTIAEATP